MLSKILGNVPRELVNLLRQLIINIQSMESLKILITISSSSPDLGLSNHAKKGSKYSFNSQVSLQRAANSPGYLLFSIAFERADLLPLTPFTPIYSHLLPFTSIYSLYSNILPFTPVYSHLLPLVKYTNVYSYLLPFFQFTPFTPIYSLYSN